MNIQKGSVYYLAISIVIWLTVLLSISACATSGTPQFKPGSTNDATANMVQPNKTSAILPLTKDQSSTSISSTAVPVTKLAVIGNENPRSFGCAGNHDLYLIDNDHKDFIRLTKNADVRDVAWAPDGSGLIFSARFTNDGYGIYRISVEGTDLTQLSPNLTGGIDRGMPTWLDSNRIVFYQSDGDRTLLHWMKIDETVPHFITEGAEPSWSPRRQELTFIKRAQGLGFGDIYTINIDDNTARRLTSDIYAKGPTWSLDGQKIAFYGYTSTSKSTGTYIMDSDGRNLIRLSSDLTPISWSPDSQYIIYATHPAPGTCKNSIEARKVDGTGTTMVYDAPANFHYAYAVWQPQIPK